MSGAIIDNQRIEEFIEALIKVARGDYNIQLELTNENNSLDALAMGINMMVDDLKKGRLAEIEKDEIKILNNELELAKRKAEESDQLKTLFLQNMSHEIRTPLNAIMGFSELISYSFDDKEKLISFSQIIQQRSSDLLDIINDILDIAKIESGQLRLNIEKCNLSELFDELNKFYFAFQERNGLKNIDFNLQVHCSNDTPIILTDKVKLKQIFINLISNAFKFTEKGFIEGGCKFVENGKLLFFVTDSGMGISKENQGIVFDRFTQVHDGVVNKYGGTGLGLSIVKGLVNLLGGKISLSSEPGKGTTFTFSIDYKPVNFSEKEDTTSDMVLSGEFTNLTLLIVEDDEFNAIYLKEVINSLGFNILTTTSGKEAIEIVANQNVDIILMDVRLPDLDGYQSTTQIRQFNKKVKIIAQTAYAAIEERQKAINAGCDDYISKPTKANDLKAIIYKHLNPDF